MLFSRDDKSGSKTKGSTNGFSFWQLFNPNVGTEIAPVFETGRMFVRMLAYILAAYKLFPKNHPAFTDDKRRLTLGELLRTSFGRLSFTREGIPQIILFVAVFGCLIFSGLFILTLIASLLMGNAHAADSATSLFQAPNASSGADWGLNWISFLFSGADIPTRSGGGGQPAGCEFQVAVGKTLSIYSSAILVLAGFLLMYHLVFMIAEQAHSGKIMGKANQIWAPIRLVFAIGMLVPITAGSSPSSGTCQVTGYNTAQYVVSQVARWGSGLGSTIWNSFVTNLASQQFPVCPSGLSSNLTEDTSTANTPSCIKNPADVSTLVKTLLAMDACAYLFGDYIKPFNSSVSYHNRSDEFVKSIKYSIPRISKLGLSTESFHGAYLGVKISEGASRDDKGAAYTDFMLKDSGQLCGGYIAPRYTKSLYDSVRTEQYKAVASIYTDIESFTKKYVDYFIPNRTSGAIDPDEMDIELRRITVKLQEKIDNAVVKSLAQADQNSSKNIATSLKDSYFTNGGWLTAGAWFTTISKLHASRSDAVRKALPIFVRPSIFNLSDEYGSGAGDFDLKLSKRTSGDVPDSVVADLTKYMAAIDLATSYPYGPASINDTSMSTAEANIYQDHEKSLRTINKSGSDVIDKVLSLLDETLSKFGVWNSKGVIGVNFGVSSDPLSELAAFGQSNVGAALYFMAVAGGSSIFSFIPGLSLLVSLAATIATLLFTIGFTMGYVIPLYPFYRFFFGSVQWIMMFFEAVVLAPLFALAHIEPEGEGLAGKKAMYGYTVLMQLLLRPALMVFGLAAGYLLFRIGVAFLNDVFIYVALGTGAYSGGFPSLAKIIYTVLYAVLVMILANQCFSTIGLFPQLALRYLGLGSPHEEKVGEPGMLSGAAAAAGAHVSGKFMGGATNIGKTTSDQIKKMRDEREANKLKEIADEGVQKRHTEQLAAADKQSGLLGALAMSQLGGGGGGGGGGGPDQPSGGTGGQGPGGAGDGGGNLMPPDREEDRFDKEVSRREGLAQSRMMDGDPEYQGLERESQRRREEAASSQFAQDAGMASNYTSGSPYAGMPGVSSPNQQADFKATTPPKPDPKLEKQREEWLAKTDGGKKPPDDWNPGA